MGLTESRIYFSNGFDEHNLPWTESGIGGGSDFVPFLLAGIASGGVNTGAGGIKSPSERGPICRKVRSRKWWHGQCCLRFMLPSTV